MGKSLTYQDAVSELEQILKNLEQSEEVNIDVISAQVKRAGELMEFCRKQLHVLDAELTKIMEEIN
jgi:exodeoxyribonuclease VII small subunit